MVRVARNGQPASPAGALHNSRFITRPATFAHEGSREERFMRKDGRFAQHTKRGREQDERR